MNPIRHVVPTAITTTARRRPTRLAPAALLFAVIMLGAVSCSDTGTEPLTPVDPGYIDDVASDEAKREATEDLGSEPSASLSSAAAAAAGPTYTVASIAFKPEVGPFTNELPGSDDHTYGSNGTAPNGPGPHPALPIGFSFMFYGQTYDRFFIGSNGVVLFSHVAKGACCSAMIPWDDQPTSTLPGHRNNLIALAWTDLKPLPSQITYTVRGTAPRRRLIVNFNQVPYFTPDGTAPHSARVTTQAILYEGTNVIEVHTTSQPNPGFNITQGVENANGTVATPVPGRNRARYTLTNDAVRFTPVGQNAVPTALPGGNAGGPPANRYEGVEGDTITFEGSGQDADGDPLTFSWDFNNDGIADANTAVAKWSYVDNSGVNPFRATLTVDDGRGGVNQASVDVVVKNAPPSVTAGSAVRINAGETVGFAGRFSDKGVNDALWGWTWNFAAIGDAYGSTDTQAAELLSSNRFCKAGTFPVRLTVTDKDGDSGNDELVVTVDALPVQIDVEPRMIVLNDNANGMVIVRIYSRDGLDATALNPNTIKLTNGRGRGTSLARTAGGLWHWNPDSDLNGDGLRDVVAMFRRDEMLKNDDLDMDTSELTLKAEVGNCGDVLGSAPVRVRVQGKPASAGSTLQPTGSP